VVLESSDFVGSGLYLPGSRFKSQEGFCSIHKTNPAARRVKSGATYRGGLRWISVLPAKKSLFRLMGKYGRLELSEAYVSEVGPEDR
jgi:hypothetical protein